MINDMAMWFHDVRAGEEFAKKCLSDAAWYKEKLEDAEEEVRKSKEQEDQNLAKIEVLQARNRFLEGLQRPAAASGSQV